ncbi:CHAT domain-containing protein [Streptomyces sp. NPDC012888]|uniref:CHAT domain-containing protein n=1 Tax=Streptomyces sp. NPDC012888 TaxID=3364855 RepID=UPI0036973110
MDDPAELRARREAILAELTTLRATDPAAAELCAEAGEIGYRLVTLHGETGEADAAAEAFAHAFRNPDGPAPHWPVWRILYGHVMAFQYDLHPDPDLVDRASTLLSDGLAGLAGGGDLETDPDRVATAALARRLLANLAWVRWFGAQHDQDLLAAALPLNERAAAADPDDPDLLLHLAHMRLVHGSLTREADSYAESARLYARALPAAAAHPPHPEREPEAIRYGRAVALTMLGTLTTDRSDLEAARDEGLRTLAAVRARGAGSPVTERDVRLLVAQARALIDDDRERELARADVAALTATPEQMDALDDFRLDLFGRLFWQAGTFQAAADDLERAIALLTRAVDRQTPGSAPVPNVPAMYLAGAQYFRHQHDADPARLPVAIRAARLVLQDDGIPSGVRAGMTMLLAVAQHLAGTEPDLSFAELLPLYQQWRRGLDAAGNPYDFGLYHPTLADNPQARANWERNFTTILMREWRDDVPESLRGEYAAQLLEVGDWLDPHRDRLGPEREAEFVDAVMRQAERDPAWRARGRAVLGHYRLAQGLQGSDALLEEALAHFEAAIEAGNDSSSVEFGARSAAALLQRRQGIIGGPAAEDDWEGLFSAMHEQPMLARRYRCARERDAAVLAGHRGDLAAVDRHLAAIAGHLAGLAGDEDMLRVEAWAMLEEVRVVRRPLAERLGHPALPPSQGRPTMDEVRATAAKFPRGRRADLLASFSRAWRVEALDSDDLVLLRSTLALSEEALSLTAAGTDDWTDLLTDLGTSYCALGTMEPDPRTGRPGPDLDQGISRLETATEAMRGPEHRLWAVAAGTLAKAYRMRHPHAPAELARARRLGLDALRGIAWSALLQSGADDVAAAVREATFLSQQVTAWCVADGAPGDAVRALDSCRALILHAATTGRSVTERLTAAGRTDLADAWRRAAAESGPDGVPGPLRLQAVRALTEGGDRLLVPPDVAEIARGLRAQRQDALVYLVPGTAECPGTAYVVTSAGEVRELPLPRLLEDARPLREYRPAGRPGRRDLLPVPGYGDGPSPAPPLRDQLDRLCAWAWRVAVRPLLDLFETPGRNPRLVLVPMGALGLVPWHAAWTGADPRPGADTGTGRRYALQDAEFSYAASARLLCEVAARPAAPHTGTALVVGDPTGDLPYAGEEAAAVQRAFYPDGTFLGLRTGDGTPRQVTDWLHRHGDGGGVLHLACHGTVEENRAHSSYLTLKGGELPAEELAASLPGRLGLVVLAACRSQVSGRGNNEAYSLSSAFLAAGSRSVIGSLWPVPDDATSVLMYMTHHYLRREGEPPARALRRAQLWVLDPARRAPDGMPPVLAGRLHRLDPHDLSAWAGFTHLGQ